MHFPLKAAPQSGTGNGPRRSRVFTPRRAAAIGIVAIAATVLAGCSSSSKKDASSSSSAGGSGSGSASAPALEIPKTGGNVTSVLAAVSSRLDPATAKLYGFTDGQTMAAIFGMLDYEDPQTGAVKMSFLKSVTSPDNTVWTLKLTPDLKFSDGTPFDAAAIMYNWQRLADPSLASIYATIVAPFKMAVVDATTLTVTLPAANTSFPAVIAESLACIGSPTAMKAEGKDFTTKPVGAGPFMLKSFTPGTSLVAVRNPNYATFAPNQPYLDQVTFQTLADAKQQFTALQSGQAQIGSDLGQSEVNGMQAAGANVVVTKTGAGGDILLNNAAAPFNDPIARQAFSLALDRTGTANAAAADTPAATNLFAKSSPFYDSKYDFPAQDKVKAQQLFDQLAAAGKPFKATYEAVPTTQSQTLAQYLQSQIAQYKNASVDIKTVPLATYTTDVRAGNFQMTIHGLYMIAPLPGTYDYFHAGGALNPYKYSNDLVNTTLDAIRQTTDMTTLKKDWGIVEQQLLNDNPIYWMQQGVVGFPTTKDITGIRVFNQGNVPDWGAIGYKK